MKLLILDKPKCKTKLTKKELDFYNALKPDKLFDVAELKKKYGNKKPKLTTAKLNKLIDKMEKD